MPKLFDKILVANRGEIALRIMRTAKRLGIKTVAIYSEVDANALHVHFADEAVYVGPPPSTGSYLSIPNIMNAIRQTGANAVHPGYGFLSENSLFAESLAREDITLIGPSAMAIARMGDKIEAKKVAQAANVNTVPGYMGVIANADEAVTIATTIGFPVIVKAAAGGGGRGMRVVRTEAEVREAFRSASNEAKNSFSDDRVFMEKFIEEPHHIEIQVLADKHGHIVCLGERECSIQRHHQKVIEEAPSPFISTETRTAMYEQSKRLAEKVGYYSAGTIEFIVDSKQQFYFLEMNTRLQVEHCVTELITGIDIVEQMIRIAAGENLLFTQDDIQLNGWAIESRIYAEDPSRGFLPSSGRIIEYNEPKKSPHLRIDSGVAAGGEVSMFYDAMIAKLCSHGPTRDDAIKYMLSGLSDFVIRGISHNISFLEALISHQKFQEGNVTTHFIDQVYPDGFFGAALTSEISQVLLVVAVFVYLTDAKRATSITGQMPGRGRHIGTRWVVNIDGTLYPVNVKPLNQGGYSVKYEKLKFTIHSNWQLGNRLLKAMINDREISVKIDFFAGGYYLTHAGRTSRVTVRSPRAAELEKFMPPTHLIHQSSQLIAPITGKIVAIKVTKNQIVKAGQELIILEAMKMENVIYAQYDATIGDIYIQNGENIQAGQMIMDFEQPDSSSHDNAPSS
jgi:propionyl-CoA carboxylase alpha chain